jgi:putative DNA primase/helicase
MGCDGDDISAAIGTRWMIAAVARVFAPGCKVDEMLILKGAQGAGKSRALQALCPDPSWFSDTALPIGEKDAFQQLAGVWIYELGEMASVRGREWEHVKAFLSSQVDRYRASYGRNTVQVPRQVIFCGSTNESAFLGDSTGQRRFWVREIGRCSPERVTELRDQLWAEAVHLFRAGEQWHMTGQEAVAAGESAERYRQVDPWEDPIREYCQGRTSVTVREILEKVLDKKVDARTRGDEQRVIAVLAGERVREHTKSGNVWRIRQ